MAKVISIRVPEWVSEEDVKHWIAEGLSRKLAKKIILKLLEEGTNINLEQALQEFEETRREVWKEIEKEYKERGLL